MRISKDLVAASATPLILAILSREESYGYAIIRKVKDLSDERVGWSEGMLYPVLHRLEKQDFISSSWRESETGRKRKYYAITGPGREELSRQREQWETVHSILSESWKTLKFSTLCWRMSVSF
ncbi:PadR family transcriptional regulator [candidate division KSB1 bacterium]